MSCKLLLINDTPPQFWRSPSNTYSIRASLSRGRSSAWCRFDGERVTVFIDNIAYPMTRVVPESDQWVLTHEALAGFSLSFVARYKVRFLFPRTPDVIKSAPARAEIVPRPQATVQPTELHFYFDQDSPNRDKRATLANTLSTAVVVNGATIGDHPNALGGQGGAAHFSLVSPTTLPAVAQPGGTIDFMVHFDDSRSEEHT